jgi:Glycosyltransferase family 87
MGQGPAVRPRGHWLDRERLTVYPRIFLVMFGIAALVYVLTMHDLMDLLGKPAGSDFITFWAASHLALHGHGVDVYDYGLLHAAQQVAVPGVESSYAWFYPPTFLLVILPLSFLPYLASFWVFVTATMGAFLATLGRAIRRWDASWLVVAFPGLWLCLAQGQNGFLTATLAGGALLLLDRRPVPAGILIGLLVIKPHLAVLFPLVLVARRSWRAFAAAAVTALGALGLATLVLGPDTPRAWVVSMDLARSLVEVGELPWTKMPATFAALRLLSLPVPWAYVGHAVVALIAVLALWRCWRRPGVSLGLRGAALMVATFLVNPYGFDYDLTWLAFPLAWVALDGMKNGWGRGDREWLVAGWLLPLMLAPLAQLAHLDVGPIVLAGLLWVITRRAGVAMPWTRHARTRGYEPPLREDAQPGAG